MASFAQYREGYEHNWRRMKIRAARQAEVEKEARAGLRNKAIYQEIERATGVPWWFTLLTHYRESHFKLDTYLGNGQSIHRVTTIVPKGRGPFPDFKAGAIDAYKIKGWIGATDWSLARATYRLEGFNGYGYHGKGVNSPYLYGGSTVYGPPEARAGKYVADHVFDPNHVDKQLGTLVILKHLDAIDPDVRFTDEAASWQDQPDEALARGTLWIQQSLNTLAGKPILLEDGVLGANTMKFLQVFQQENGLEPDGLPDPETIAEIERHLAKPAEPAGAPAPGPVSDTPAPAPRDGRGRLDRLDDATRDFLRGLFGKD